MRNDVRIVFMGTPELAATCLQALIDDNRNVVLAVCQPDKPVGRKMVITPPPVKVTAVAAGIEVFQPDSMKTEDSISKIKEAEPDIIITAAYGKILPKEVLDTPKYGCLNVHGSLLPMYRGASPVQQAILDGQTETGVTIMKMDVGMDTGDMLVTVKCPIDENVHTDSLMAQLASLGAKTLVESLDDIIEGKVTAVPQDHDNATYCSKIGSSDGEFSWDGDAKAIHDKVRAFSGWPGAYVLAATGKKVKIYDTNFLDSFDEADTASFAAGTIVKARKGDLIVKCGKGFLKINELQTEGGKRLAARDCAHNYKVGELF